jgi:hypothetical protein
MIVLADRWIEPQRLKPRDWHDCNGTAEAVPLRKRLLAVESPALHS